MTSSWVKIQTTLLYHVVALILKVVLNFIEIVIVIKLQTFPFIETN